MKTKYRKFNCLINSDLGRQLAVVQEHLGVRRGIRMMNAEFKFSKARKFHRGKWVCPLRVQPYH